MIKLIACDLDGTLLQNGATKPDPEVFPLIERLFDKKILFVVASGRQYSCIRRMFEPVKDKIGYVCENGALCIYHDRIIARSALSHDLGYRILQSIRDRENCEILLSGKNVSYLESKDPAYVNHIKYVVGNDVAIVSDIMKVSEPFYKISVCNFHGIDNCDAYFINKFSSEANVVTSGNIWLDFMEPHTNKGAALSALAQYLGFTAAECAAFGDHYNDVEMLKYVGESYAMENAQPGIAELCRHSCRRVEDTLRQILDTASMPDTGHIKGGAA